MDGQNWRTLKWVAIRVPCQTSEQLRSIGFVSICKGKLVTYTAIIQKKKSILLCQFEV